LYFSIQPLFVYRLIDINNPGNCDCYHGHDHGREHGCLRQLCDGVRGTRPNNLIKVLTKTVTAPSIYKLAFSWYSLFSLRVFPYYLFLTSKSPAEKTLWEICYKSFLKLFRVFIV